MCFKLVNPLKGLHITYFFLHVPTRCILTAEVQVHEENLASTCLCLCVRLQIVLTK